MYTCTTCNKWSKTQGRCWKCGKPMVQTDKVWKPKATIDDKSKSGTRDHVAMLSLATRCLLRAELAEETSGHVEDIDAVVTKRWEDREQGDKAPWAVQQLKGEVAKAIMAMSASLGGEHGQFLVNLAMYNYRTAGGGRARKIADWLRMNAQGAPDLISYVRPFEGPLPVTIRDLLMYCTCTGGGATADAPSIVRLCGWRDGKYVPPSRFTATFPFQIEQAKGDPKVVEIGEQIKYAFMGSFGFAEPSYSTWVEGEEGTGAEYSGTRLSLGAYSLCPDYLADLLQLIRSTEAAQEDWQWDGYRRYGGVGRLHVETLFKVARKRGYQMAIAWASQMVEIGLCLVDKALTSATQRAKKEKEEVDKGEPNEEMEEVSKRRALTGLCTFLGVARRKIEQCDAKVSVLDQQGYSLTGFEHIWVQESSLWELSFLAASCISLRDIKDALGTLGALESWQPSVGDDPTLIHEAVELPTSFVFDRVLAPSGTAAAKKLYDTLAALDYATVSPEIGKKKLDPFTPYFEFYLDEGFLGKKESVKVEKPVGVQVWVNLSDSLHADLLGADVKLSEAADLIATMLIRYAGPLSDTGPLNVYVIDYTKFAGEMPHCVVYPILAGLATRLCAEKLAGRVVFLCSNLKYHTGSLERYQSGEILLPRAMGKDALLDGVKHRLQSCFTDEGQGWELRGAYVPLMKKMYLIADAIAWLRWSVYAKAYLESVDRRVLDQVSGFQDIKVDRGERLRENIVALLTTISQRLAAIARDVAWGVFSNGALRAYIPSVEVFETQLTEVRRRVTQCLEQARNQSLRGPVAITVLSPEQVSYLEGPFRKLRLALHGAVGSRSTQIPEQRRAAILAHFRALKEAWYRLRALVPDRGRRPPSALPAPLSREVRSSLDVTLGVLRACEPVMTNLGADATRKPFKHNLDRTLVATLRLDAREFSEDLASLASVTKHRFLDSDVRLLVELKLRQVAAVLPQTLRRLGTALREARVDVKVAKDLKQTLQSYEQRLQHLLKSAVGLSDVLPESEIDVPKQRLHLGVIDLGDGDKTQLTVDRPTTSKLVSIKPVSTSTKKPPLLESTKKPSLLGSSSTKGKKVGEEDDRHWYTGEEIALLLRLRLTDIRDRLYLMLGINAHQHDGYTIADNLREAREAAFLADSEAILLPVHVGDNHWTALYIAFEGDYDSPTVQYVDPQGTRDILDSLREAIAVIFPNRTLRPRSRVAYQPPQDGYNCGPWTVALLEYMARNDGALPALDTIQIAVRRRDDTSRIDAAL